MKRRSLSKQWLGFTLLEVLIALAILAISSLAVMTQTGMSLRQLNVLELKTTALIIADNRLAMYRVADEWPATGRSSESLTAADQQWLVRVEVSQTSEAWLRKIEVTVSLDDGAEGAILGNLIGYRGRY